jgi:hypothetical protein
MFVGPPLRNHVRSTEINVILGWRYAQLTGTDWPSRGLLFETSVTSYGISCHAFLLICGT